MAVVKLVKRQEAEFYLWSALAARGRRAAVHFAPFVWAEGLGVIDGCGKRGTVEWHSRRAQHLRESQGVTGQSTTIDELLSVVDNVRGGVGTAAGASSPEPSTHGYLQKQLRAIGLIDWWLDVNAETWTRVARDAKTLCALMPVLHAVWLPAGRAQGAVALEALTAPVRAGACFDFKLGGLGYCDGVRRLTACPGGVLPEGVPSGLGTLDVMQGAGEWSPKGWNASRHDSPGSPAPAGDKSPSTPTEKMPGGLGSPRPVTVRERNKLSATPWISEDKLQRLALKSAQRGFARLGFCVCGAERLARGRVPLAHVDAQEARARKHARYALQDAPAVRAALAAELALTPATRTAVARKIRALTDAFRTQTSFAFFGLSLFVAVDTEPSGDIPAQNGHADPHLNANPNGDHAETPPHVMVRLIDFAHTHVHGFHELWTFSLEPGTFRPIGAPATSAPQPDARVLTGLTNIGDLWE